MNQNRHTSELLEVFVGEHQTLIRGLVAVLNMVKTGDLAAARELADQLDRDVGPHIQFEEEVLYPIVGRARGLPYETELRGEHETVQKAIKRLIESDLSVADSGELQKELEPALEVGIDHAESCGTLTSHLATLSPQMQHEVLARHNQLCQQSVRWTELSGSSP